MIGWKKNTESLHVLEDKYACRYVDQLLHRCVAVKFFFGTATYSDTVVFWHKDFATPEDALKAAKTSLMRGEFQGLANEEEERYLSNINVSSDRLSFPLAQIEKKGW